MTGDDLHDQAQETASNIQTEITKLVHRFVRGQPAQMLISMNRCCEKAVPLGRATCPDCEEISAGYQASMTSRETPPWE